MPDTAIPDLISPDTCRLVVRHERESRFRWMALVEMVVVAAGILVVGPLLLLSLMVLPLAALAMLGPVAAQVVLVGGSLLGLAGIAEGPFRLLARVLFAKHRHVLVVEARGSEGANLSQARLQPAGVGEGEAMLARILALAGERGIVVSETLGGEVAECAELWFGGRPLLAQPGLPSLRAAQDALEVGRTIAQDLDDSFLLRRDTISRGRVGGGLWFLVLLCVAPLRVWMRVPVRQDLSHAWRDFRGIAPARWIMEVGPDRVCVRQERADRRVWEEAVEGIVGVTWSPVLDWGRLVRRQAATLRVVGHSRTISIPIDAVGPRGAALRSWMVGAILELRSRKSESGLPWGEPGPTRCPYCGALYLVGPGASCPSCGAWPEAVRA